MNVDIHNRFNLNTNTCKENLNNFIKSKQFLTFKKKLVHI